MKPDIKVKVGDLAPQFSATNQDGNLIAIKDFRGKHVVLYFYPKAMTPGCTTQACAIRDNLDEFSRRNTVVLGISPDLPARLSRFSEKQALNFELLSDEIHSVAELFGVWGPKKFMGREFDGIHRTTFLISPDGVIEAIMHPVKTKTHHNDVLAIIDNL